MNVRDATPLTSSPASIGTAQPTTSARTLLGALVSPMTRDDVDTARAAASVSADDPPAEITTTSVSSAIGVTRAMDELSAVAAIPCRAHPPGRDFGGVAR